MILDNNLSFFYVLILFLVIGAIIFIVLIQPRLNIKMSMAHQSLLPKKKLLKRLKKKIFIISKKLAFLFILKIKIISLNMFTLII